VEQTKMLVGATKLRPLKGEKLKYILDRLTPIDPASLDEAGEVRTNELLYAQVEQILRDAGDEAPEKTTAFMKKKNGNNFLLLNIESVAAVGRLDDLAVRCRDPHDHNITRPSGTETSPTLPPPAKQGYSRG
jgi:hypothetical protein